MNLQISKISHPIATSANVQLVMARADKLHPLASGNKYYKLKSSLVLAKQKKLKGLLSFGGAFSNHIHALALTAQEAGLKSVGIIRGEEQYATNPTLTVTRKAGMKLEFISRDAYRQKTDPKYLDDLQKRYPDYLIIPEGGSNQLAISGCKGLAYEINAINSMEHIFDSLLVASGTGATLAGLICGSIESQRIIGYSVLRDQSLESKVSEFLINEHCHKSNYHIEQAHFGGYAKIDKMLLDFIFDWYEQTQILLDPIYTSKLCMCLIQQIDAGYFKEGASLCIVHTGGLQGWFGMEKKVIELCGVESWCKIRNNLDNSI